jgi:hypothetical protein
MQASLLRATGIAQLDFYGSAWFIEDQQAKWSTIRGHFDQKWKEIPAIYSKIAKIDQIICTQNLPRLDQLRWI